MWLERALERALERQAEYSARPWPGSGRVTAAVWAAQRLPTEWPLAA